MEYIRIGLLAISGLYIVGAWLISLFVHPTEQDKHQRIQSMALIAIALSLLVIGLGTL